jgi:outer membrane protein OmpA-like peptidoglycan-associated protein
MRTGLLIAVTVALLAAPSMTAQIAPSVTGETGLFALTNGEMLPMGRFSFSLFYNQSALTAAPSLVWGYGSEDPLRYTTGKLGVTVGFGLTSNLEASLSAGQRYFSADDKAWSGSINGFERTGRIRHSETDKPRLGLKWLLNPKADLVKVALFAGLHFPMQGKFDEDALSTHRADYDFGASFNYKAFTVQLAYLLAGDKAEQFDVANQLTWGLGIAVPVIKDSLRVIGEVNRVHFEGGDSRPGDYSEAILGARFALGQTGIVATGALRVNVDRWVKYGSKPSNIGGLVQIAYSPQVSDADRPVVPHSASEPALASAPEPEPEPAPATPAPAPTAGPVEPPPAPKGETSTTDEVLFDTAKGRLTNIAKAILDGVALRLKNNLSATCTITSFTDPKEKGGDHAKLATTRADAAKDYLVKRHGIDASRIRIEAKGDAEAGSDAVRNRRAVVSVSFP